MREGDMVITPSGKIGLLVATDGLIGKVRFVQNGPWVKYKLSQLRRATLAEVEASHLSGVGCNQAEEG